MPIFLAAVKEHGKHQNSFRSVIEADTYPEAALKVLPGVIEGYAASGDMAPCTFVITVVAKTAGSNPKSWKVVLPSVVYDECEVPSDVAFRKT